MWIQSCRRAVLPGVLFCLITAANQAAAAQPPLPEPKWRSWQTGALRPDRLQHVSFSMSASLGIGLVAEEPVAGLVSSALLGIGKEVIDTRASHFDWGDLAADFVGAGLGALAAAAMLP